MVALTLHAQDKVPSYMILVGFNFPPDHNFRTLKNNDGSSSSDLLINTRNSRKWPGLAITHD